MRKRQKAEESLFQAVAEKIRALGVEPIDLRFTNENGKRFLRVYIDKRAGVSLEDCEAVSLMLDPIFDEMGQDRHDYFEVSSPGLDRPLLTAVDFRLHAGEQVELKLYQQRDGQKLWRGALGAVDEKTLCIEDAAGTEHCFGREEIAIVKRALVF